MLFLVAFIIFFFSSKTSLELLFFGTKFASFPSCYKWPSASGPSTTHRYSRWIPWSRRWEFYRHQKLTLAISRTTRHNRSADRNGAQRTPVSGAVPPSLLPISEGGTGTYRTFDGAKRAFSIESSHPDLLNPQGVSSRTLPSAADPPTLNRSRTLLR
jgi:hypothetical protein